MIGSLLPLIGGSLDCARDDIYSKVVDIALNRGSWFPVREILRLFSVENFASQTAQNDIVTATFLLDRNTSDRDSKFQIPKSKFHIN